MCIRDRIGVEDVLQYMDEHFDAENDSRIKLLYIESIGDVYKRQGRGFPV